MQVAAWYTGGFKPDKEAGRYMHPPRTLHARARQKRNNVQARQLADALKKVVNVARMKYFPVLSILLTALASCACIASTTCIELDVHCSVKKATLNMPGRCCNKEHNTHAATPASKRNCMHMQRQTDEGQHA